MRPRAIVFAFAVAPQFEPGSEAHHRLGTLFLKSGKAAARLGAERKLLEEVRRSFFSEVL